MASPAAALMSDSYKVKASFRHLPDAACNACLVPEHLHENTWHCLEAPTSHCRWLGPIYASAPARESHGGQDAVMEA